MEALIIGISDWIVDHKDIIIYLVLFFGTIFTKSAVAISRVNKDVIADYEAKKEKWTDQEKLDQAVDYFQTLFGAKIPFINLPLVDQIVHATIQFVYDRIHPKN